MQAHYHQSTSQPKEIWFHLYRPITIMQYVSLRTAGRSHTGSSPLGNKTARGQPAALRQVQQRENYLPACVTITSKAPISFSHPLFYITNIAFGIDDHENLECKIS